MLKANKLWIEWSIQMEPIKKYCEIYEKVPWFISIRIGLEKLKEKTFLGESSR